MPFPNPKYLTCLVLLYLAFGLQCASAHAPAHRGLNPRDAFTKFSNSQNDEGEDHSSLKAPSGARIRDISIGDGGEEIPVFWSDPLTNQKAEATHAFVVIHGRLRDGANYWEIMNDALQSALDDEYPGADRKSFIIAPQFFSEKLNEGQYSKNELAFEDVNAWQAGDTASHPKGTNVTSMDALDAIIATFSDKNEYPSITNITLVGHGGGGQLIARYAAVGADAPEGVHLRYIIGDPSTNAYFTKDRPVENHSGDPSCDFWNTWRYGYENFNGTRTSGNKTSFDYFTKYINRDIIFLIAGNDTIPNGDQYCPALMQGGSARRDRNLAWWTYINTLARTQEPVQLFQQTLNNTPHFKNLPNWSNVTSKTRGIGPRLIVIEDVTHNAAKVLGGTEGRAALFSSSQLPMGWRPDGWNTTQADCSMCDDSRDNQGSEDSGDDDDGGDDGSSGSDNGSVPVHIPLPTCLLAPLVTFTLAPLFL
ncbi:hypothetical protein VKT23_009174 [Stygiomarasmius scandens]|uniref:Transmembrane protein n=1 Tax=Marasmiellus scandens TaxID=2682957 RepID=A0ABR1JEN6_9AGAR